jgi:hypothetical protein
MTYLWRLQQTQVIVSMLLWAVLLTLTSYQYVGWRLQQTFFNNIYLGFIFLFLIIFGLIVLVGFAFDSIFKLWKEQNIVSARRNPYAREKIYTKEIVLWRRLFLPILEKYKEDDPKVRENIDFMEKWIQKCLEDDPNIQKEVDEVESWVLNKGPA